MGRKTRVIILITALLVSLCCMSVTAGASVPPKIILNGQVMLFDAGAKPVFVGDRVFVPMRAIFEALGLKVSWNGDAQEITSFRDGNMFLKLKINDNLAVLNNNTVKIDAPPKLINGRTFVPLRFVSESVGASVTYNGDSNTVYINTSNARN